MRKDIYDQAVLKRMSVFDLYTSESVAGVGHILQCTETKATKSFTSSYQIQQKLATGQIILI